MPMNKVLCGLTGPNALIYLDDNIICGITLGEHKDKSLEVFDRLRVHSLKLQPDKCESQFKKLC
jgi:hypothetical protein